MLYVRYLYKVCMVAISSLLSMLYVRYWYKVCMVAISSCNSLISLLSVFFLTAVNAVCPILVQSLHGCNFLLQFIDLPSFCLFPHCCQCCMSDTGTKSAWLQFPPAI